MIMPSFCCAFPKDLTLFQSGMEISGEIYCKLRAARWRTEDALFVQDDSYSNGLKFVLVKALDSVF